MAVLCNHALYSLHIGGLHHQSDSLSLPDFHHPLKHQGVVVAGGESRYCHHLVTDTHYIVGVHAMDPFPIPIPHPVSSSIQYNDTIIFFSHILLFDY